MPETFVSEAIRPEAGSFDGGAMATGAPGVPAVFSWRGRSYAVMEILRTWKQTGPCRHGSGERYVRRHWFEVRTAEGWIMKLYFERTTRGTSRGERWWLFTVRSSDDEIDKL